MFAPDFPIIDPAILLGISKRASNLFPALERFIVVSEDVSSKLVLRPLFMFLENGQSMGALYTVDLAIVRDTYKTLF